MFSGIVEEAAKVVKVVKEGGNVHLTVRSGFVDELRIDQSVAHNGVCLTVVALPGDGTYTVTAIDETLKRSNLGLLHEGSRVNLERCMVMNGRLDGHIVQGHVDCTAECVGIEEVEGSRYFKFRYDVAKEMIHHTLYIRPHQFRRHKSRHHRQHRIRHNRQIHLPHDG